MRLLNIYILIFKEFLNSFISGYAILSYWWSNEEVTFQQMKASQTFYSLGLSKIKGFYYIVKGSGRS